MDQNYISHSGTPQNYDFDPHGSGRYRQGSGANPYQHDNSLRGLVKKMRNDGLKDSEIAVALLGDRATASDLKAYMTIELERERAAKREKVLKLYESGMGASDIARELYGDPSKESSVRSLLDSAIAAKHERYQNTAEMLKEAIANSSSGIVDVGTGQELYLGVTKDTLNVAKKMLEEEGYVASWVTIPQANGNELVVKVLAKPGMEWRDIQANKYNVDPLVAYSPDEGLTFRTAKAPVFIDGKRVLIRYDEEGGTAKDGTIELRPGVDDISLGGPLYAQVRIAVKGEDGKQGFMKGMAFYNDQIPEGYDVIYNTNKKSGTQAFPNPDDPNASSVYKAMKPDKDNPFGATIKAGGQPNYIGKDGKEHQGVINKLSEEGDWSDWGKTVASQFLSKQNIDLIRKQLDVTILDKKAELEGIMNLTNPVIKQKLLNDFAEQTDAQTVKLPAKAPKGSAFQVLLPIPTLKDTEVYAPNYENGDQVALIRYPHGGIFEIPILTVNNKNKEGSRILTKNAKDAIGINQKTADILSGADFDGDTAIVIPIKSNGIKISNREPLIKDFDHKSLYKLPNSAPEVKDSVKQKQMGIITNLITDMTVQGASWSELERAVKHSMVVIDAVKHHLDMNASYKDNNIDDLKAKYQGYSKSGKPGGGASTILSRASSEERIPVRKEITDTKKMTEEQLKAFNAGKHVYVDSGKKTKGVERITDPKKMTADELEKYNSGRQVYRETGKVTDKIEKVAKIRLTDDAMTLVRDKDNQKEVAYAKFANELKALANTARKNARNLDLGKASPSAKETYKAEVESLNAKLRQAQLNSPKERQAQIIAKRVTNEKIKNDYSYDIDYEHRKKLEAQELERARAQVGAKKQPVVIEPKEWEAIQAGAVAPTKLKTILNNTDQDKFKAMAVPKNKSTLTSAEISLINRMKASGQYTNKEIAEKLNISASTVSKYT